MTDLGIVKQAIQFLGLSYSIDKAYRSLNTKEKMPLVIDMPGWDIGLHFVDGKIELKADSYAYIEAARQGKIPKFLKKGERLNELRFSGILQQAYNITNATSLAEQMGHRIIVSEPDDNGNVHAQILVR